VGKMRQRTMLGDTMLRETLQRELARCLRGRLLDEWIEKSAVACLYSFNRLAVSGLTCEVFIAQSIGYSVRHISTKSSAQNVQQKYDLSLCLLTLPIMELLWGFLSTKPVRLGDDG
jgi:hypothetical protein